MLAVVEISSVSSSEIFSANRASVMDIIADGLPVAGRKSSLQLTGTGCSEPAEDAGGGGPAWRAVLCNK